MHVPAAKDVDVDIDKYLNPFIPRSRIHRLPPPVSRFLGYRAKPRKELGNVIIAAWSFIGAFCGVALLEGVSMTHSIRAYGAPLIIGSFGAAAILEYNTIESPLAQPRNSILGHFLAALVGICVTKLFELNPNFEELRWLAGAFSVGLASAVMVLTKTIYPPAGATALLAAVDYTVSRLGWYLLPLVLLSSVLTTLSALMINNIQRQWPIYWWTPVDLSKGRSSDIEDAASKDSKFSMEGKVSHDEGSSGSQDITITTDRIVIPEHLYLASEERVVLEVLKDRLREGQTKSEDASAYSPG